MQDVFFVVTDRVGLTNWEALNQVLTTGQVQVPASGTRAQATGQKRDIRLVPVVNPQVDAGKLAWAFVALATRENKKAG